MSLRACIPISGREVLTFENGQAKGYAAPIANEMWQLFARQFKNTSMIMSDKLGDIIDEKEQRYDGCIGEMQQNRVDAAVMPSNYPMIAPNITNGRVTITSTTTMFSGYNNSFDSSNTDVMEFFREFKVSLWILTMFAMMVLIIVQILTIKLKRRRRSFLHWVENLFISTVLKQFSSLTIDSSRFSVRLMLFLICFYVLQVQIFLTSMVKTDMVVQKAPDTISTYEQLLQHPNTNPLWLVTLNTHWEFKNAEKGSPAERIWQRAKKVGINKCLRSSDMSKFTDDVVNVIKQKIVIFIPDMAVRGMVSNVCALTHSSGLLANSHFWSRSDAAAVEQLLTNSRSSHAPKETALTLDKLATTILEQGLVFKIMTFMETLFVGDMKFSDLEVCTANFIIYPEHVFESANLPHYSGLWKLTGTLCSLATALFVWEMVMLYLRV